MIELVNEMHVKDIYLFEVRETCRLQNYIKQMSKFDHVKVFHRWSHI